MQVFKNDEVAKEVQDRVMTMISIAHRTNGIYTESELQGDSNVWLTFKFDTMTAGNMFVHKLQMRGSDVKGFKNVDAMTIKVLV